MVTIEFLCIARGTLLIATDQLTILDGADEAAERRRGWVEVLDKLAGQFKRGE